MEKKAGEDEVGRELKENNETIVHYLMEMRTQREELMFLIQKQIDERKKLEAEMERLTYKLCLINKSMAQRIKAKQNYDSTLEEIEEKYRRLKENSLDLRSIVAKDCEQLDSIINKKTSTEDTAASPVEEEPPKTPQTVHTSVHTVTSDVVTDAASHTSMIKSSHEDCVCPANKDGKCIREKMASKMIQAPSVETEVPTKLEKESNDNKKRDSDTSKHSGAKAAQTSIIGEPDSTTSSSSEDEKDNEDKKKRSFEMHKDDKDDDDKKRRSFETQKSKLTRAANQYKDASLRRSL